MEEKIIIFRTEKDFNPINDAAIEFKIIIIIILFFDNSIEIIIIGKNFWIVRINAIINQDNFSAILNIHSWNGNIPIFKNIITINK